MTIDDLIQNQINRIADLQAKQIESEKSAIKGDLRISSPVITKDQMMDYERALMSERLGAAGAGLARTIEQRDQSIVFIPGLISQEISILERLVQIKLGLVQCQISK